MTVTANRFSASQFSAKRFIAKRFSLRARLASACIALTISSYGTSAAASTAQEGAACTPDVFRLCSSEIPNLDGITACMIRQRSKLSPACTAVFHPPTASAATRSLSAVDVY
jgi:hypothetical protein